jgi:thiamine kinase-like enzyme
MKFWDECCGIQTFMSQFSNMSVGLIASFVQGKDRWNETYFKHNYLVLDADSRYTSTTSSSLPHHKEPVERTYESSSSSSSEDYLISYRPESISKEQIDDLLDESFMIQVMKSRVLPGLNLKFEISKCTINPLKVSRKGGIATIEYQLTQKLGGQSKGELISKTLVGKWRRDGRLKQVFDNLMILWSQGPWKEGSHGSDMRSRQRICQPIAYFSDYNFMLTSSANGVLLENFLKDGDNNPNVLETAVIQSAKWLANLHSMAAARGQNIFSLKDEEEKLSKSYEHLSALYPAFAARIQKVLLYILDEQKKLEPKDFVFVHGDFHPLNILVEGSHLTVVDFEYSCVFDPAKDLGYFLSYLLMRKEKYGLSLDIEELQQVFLRKYFEEMSLTTEVPAIAASIERLELYKARSYLQHLHFRYWTLKRRLDESYLRHWVAEAEKCMLRTTN